MDEFDPVRWCELQAQEPILRAKMDEGNGYVGSKDNESARAWWACAAEILFMYRVGQTVGRPPKLPPGMVMMLHTVALSFSTGNAAVFADMVTSGNRPLASPLMADYVGWATLYLRMADEGHIVDSTPVKSVMDAYGTTRTATQKWSKADLPASFAHLPWLHTPAYVTNKMITSGAAYRETFSRRHRRVDGRSGPDAS